MNKEINKLEEPLNTNERFLHAISVRLDVLIHMMSSFMEVYAQQNNITTTSNEVKTEVVPVEVKAEVVKTKRVKK